MSHVIDRPGSRRRGALLPFGLLLAAVACAGCSGDGRPAAEPTSPTAVVPTVESGSPSAVPYDDGAVSGTDLPEPSTLVLADALDTHAPVDAASLPTGINAVQVQALRQAWNERGPRIEEVESAPGENATPGGVCMALPGDVWALTLPTRDAAPVLALGVAEEGEFSCAWREAVVLVDTADNTVLGDDAVALLM